MNVRAKGRLLLLRRPTNRTAKASVTRGVQRGVRNVVVNVLATTRIVDRRRDVREGVPFRHLPTFHHLRGFLQWLPCKRVPAKGKDGPFFYRPGHFFPQGVSNGNRRYVVEYVGAGGRFLCLIRHNVNGIERIFPSDEPTVEVHLVDREAGRVSRVAVQLIRTALFGFLRRCHALRFGALLARYRFRRTIKLRPRTSFRVQF